MGQSSINTSASVASIRSETEILRFCLAHALENELPVALWRLPASPFTHLIISQQYRQLEKNETIEELPTGFIFSPFDPAQPSLYLPGDQMFTFENGMLREPATPVEAASASWLEEKFMRIPPVHPLRTRYAEQTSAGQRPDYLELVRKCIAEVEKGTFEKIVPSRTRLVDLGSDFDVVQAFENLCSRYSSALVSFVSIPRVGNWMGATPEQLVSVEDSKTFRTVALAGTMPYNEGMNLKTVAWTQKEIEEQALVERYVISCFKKIRLREYEEHGPRTMVAGNLVHLKSDFTVDLTATNFPQLGSVMLRLLHPTSAVCGMPLESALTFLKENEGYDREFYAGYLGPVNVKNNIDLFVNLRCMKLLDDKALLYAGAGVTVDSVASDELGETEIKFNTLLKAIF